MCLSTSFVIQFLHGAEKLKLYICHFLGIQLVYYLNFLLVDILSGQIKLLDLIEALG